MVGHDPAHQVVAIGLHVGHPAQPGARVGLAVVVDLTELAHLGTGKQGGRGEGVLLSVQGWG